MPYQQAIVQHLQQHGGVAQVQNQRGGSFTATLFLDEGYVHVSCLGASPNIPLTAFDAIECLLEETQGQALRGSAMNSRLGTAELPLESVEGWVAHQVFGRQKGDTVFRRITPMACLLVWAGVCVHGRGVLTDPSLKQ